MLPKYARFLGTLIAISLAMHFSADVMALLGVSDTPLFSLLITLLLIPVSLSALAFLLYGLASVFALVFGKGALLISLMILFPQWNGVMQ
jgi:hypothetical protein